MLDHDEPGRPIRAGSYAEESAQLLGDDPILVPHLDRKTGALGRLPDGFGKGFRCLVQGRRVDPIPSDVGGFGGDQSLGERFLIAVDQLEGFDR